MADVNPFFIEIKKRPDLVTYCNTDITELPESYIGKNSLRAILLGADPTNNGTKTHKGLKKLKFVFDIGGDYEKDFFALQSTNLAAIGLTKEDCFIQNICRNYFNNQTAENKHWHEVAELWRPTLINELSKLDPKIPILATCNEVFTFLTGIKGPYTKIYSLETKSDFVSPDFNRRVFPLFRGRAYIFHKKKWMNYRNFLKNYFAQ